MPTTKESKIQMLNSNTLGAEPSVAAMDFGELAVNHKDGIIFTINGKGDFHRFRYDYPTSINGLKEGPIGIVGGDNITVSNAGIAGGTITINASITGSYAGHIEAPVNKTFHLDPKLPANREVIEFYAVCGTGGCTATLHGNGNSIGVVSVSTTPSTAGFLGNTTLSAGNTLELRITNTVSCFDFSFAVAYKQT